MQAIETEPRASETWVDSHGHRCLIRGIATPADALEFEFTAVNSETAEPILYSPDLEGNLRYLGTVDDVPLVVYWYTPQDRRAMTVTGFLEEFSRVVAGAGAEEG